MRVCTHTSPSGCHSGSCATPRKASSSGKKRSRSVSSRNLKPIDGFAARSSSFLISSNTRSPDSSLRSSFRHSATSSSSGVISRRAASWATRRPRSGSSGKRTGSVARSPRRSRSRRPWWGSSTSPERGSRPMLLTVRSRRRAASAKSSPGSGATSKPRCPGPRLLSRRGREKSTSIPPTRNTPKARPTACTLPKPARSASSRATSRPNTSTSTSFERTPRRRSRTQPPTTTARPPAPRTVRATSISFGSSGTRGSSPEARLRRCILPPDGRPAVQSAVASTGSRAAKSRSTSAPVL